MEEGAERPAAARRDSSPQPDLTVAPQVGRGGCRGWAFCRGGPLTSALQDFNISTLSEMDRLSTSEVAMFLESCQLRDYSSAD